MVNPGQPPTRIQFSQRSFTRIIAGLIVIAGLYLLLSFYRFILNDELNQAALKGDLKTVKVLLKWGASVNGRSMHYMTPLMSAAEGGHTDVATFLIGKGADVNAVTGSGSVLMWAASSGNPGLIRLLLNQGANVHWHNRYNGKALETAQQYHHPEAIRILKQAESQK